MGPIRDSIGTQGIQNSLCILGIFGYLKYVFGVIDIFLNFGFGFTVIVSDLGKISNFKNIFGI